MFDSTNYEMLIDSCKKTIATVGGDGHTEYVLYQNKSTNDYEIHYFSLYVGMKEEYHEFKVVDENIYKELMQLIDDSNLIAYKDVRGFGLCGGDYICKFKKDNEFIRIATENTYGDTRALVSIFNSMAAYYGQIGGNNEENN